MTHQRLQSITSRYASLRIAVVGDYCLDRYLEIDSAKSEISIETGLPVHNVMRVRPQPGGAGTILSNLAALGIMEIHAVGFCGDDGEGWELRRALEALPGVRMDRFLTRSDRRTFTYCKPLLMTSAVPPRELNRLDSKNWSATPESLSQAMSSSVLELAPFVNAIVLLDQVDLPETGVVTQSVQNAAHQVQQQNTGLLVLADSRRGLCAFPPLSFKVNAAELAALSHAPSSCDLAAIQKQAVSLATRNGRAVYVTLAENGIVGASPDGSAQHISALPVRGPIDIVGAGDSVTANLAAALAAGASTAEAMQIAMAAASALVHQIGTTGQASIADIKSLLAED